MSSSILPFNGDISTAVDWVNDVITTASLVDSGLEQGVAGYLLKADKFETTFGEAFIKPVHPGPEPVKPDEQSFKHFKREHDFWSDKNDKYLKATGAVKTF